MKKLLLVLAFVSTSLVASEKKQYKHDKLNYSLKAYNALNENLDFSLSYEPIYNSSYSVGVNGGFGILSSQDTSVFLGLLTTQSSGFIGSKTTVNLGVQFTEKNEYYLQAEQGIFTRIQSNKLGLSSRALEIGVGYKRFLNIENNKNAFIYPYMAVNF